MLNFTRRGQLRHLIHSCLVASFALPMPPPPLQTVTQTGLYESGAPSVGLNRYAVQS